MFDGMIGRKIGGVTLELLLGHGTMGAVFQARQASLGRRVAVKVLLPELLKNQQAVKRFYREGQALASLKDPHVVQVFDAGQTDDGIYYLIMEFLEGRDLATILREQGALPPNDALKLIIQASEGLASAHDAGLIHRDIKPSNLMISPKGRLTITDFGLVRQQESGMMTTQSGQIVGTPAYMSPEQSVTNDVTPSTDLYSLGIVFFEILTGKPPFWASSALETLVLHISQPLPDPLESCPDLPPDVVAIVQTLAAKKPHQRYPNAHHVIQIAKAALQRLEHGSLEPSSLLTLATSAPTTWEMAAPVLPEGVPASSSLGWDEPPPSQSNPILRTDPELPLIPGGEHLFSRPSPSSPNQHSLSIAPTSDLPEEIELEHSLEIPPSSPRAKELHPMMQTELETEIPLKIKEYRASWNTPSSLPSDTRKTDLVPAIPPSLASPPSAPSPRRKGFFLFLLALALLFAAFFAWFFFPSDPPSPHPPKSSSSPTPPVENAKLTFRLPLPMLHCQVFDQKTLLSPSSPRTYTLQRPPGLFSLFLLCPRPPYAAITFSFSLRAERHISYIPPAHQGILFLHSSPPSRLFLPRHPSSLGHSQTELSFFEGKHQLRLLTSTSPPRPPYLVSVDITPKHRNLAVFRLADTAKLERLEPQKKSD